MNRIQNSHPACYRTASRGMDGPCHGGMGHLLSMKDPGRAPTQLLVNLGRAALNLCIHVFLNVSPFFVGQITQTEKAGWKGECLFNYQRDGPIVFLADVTFCVPPSVVCVPRPLPAVLRVAEALVWSAIDVPVASSGCAVSPRI